MYEGAPALGHRDGCSVRGGAHRRQLDETVSQIRLALEQASGARLRECFRVGLTFVTQHIETCGHDQCRGQAGKVLGEQRGDVWFGIALAGARIVVRREGVAVRNTEKKPLVEEVVRRAVCQAIDGWVDEELSAGWAGTRRAPCNDGRKVRPGAVTANGDPARVRAELGGVCLCPAERRLGVLDCSREWVLRREAVIRAQHMLTRMPAQQAAHLIVRVEIAEHEAAAVIVNEERGCGRASRTWFWHVVPSRNRTSPARDLEVMHSANGRGTATDRQDLTPETRTRSRG